MATEHVFHLALASDWETAQVAGDYRVSTLGVSLEQEGFLHASFAHQWEGVLARYYADVEEPLVLLTSTRTCSTCRWLSRPRRAPTRRSRTSTGRSRWPPSWTRDRSRPAADAGGCLEFLTVLVG